MIFFVRIFVIHASLRFLVVFRSQMMIYLTNAVFARVASEASDYRLLHMLLDNMIS